MIPAPIIRGLACQLYVNYEQFTQGVFNLDDDLQLGKCLFILRAYLYKYKTSLRRDNVSYQVFILRKYL